MMDEKVARLERQVEGLTHFCETLRDTVTVSAMLSKLQEKAIVQLQERITKLEKAREFDFSEN